MAAAVAVLAVIGASVALPRLLTGSAGLAGKPGISASALAHDPPFQVIVTRAGTGTSLLVRTPAGHVDSRLAPPQGTTWGDVTATANPRKFIVATSPNTRANWNPLRLYTLTLSARGAVTHLTPLAVGSLPVGGMLFAWMYDMPSSASAPSPASTAYLINPANRTKTAVRLPGLPSGQYSWLAW